MRTKNLGLAAYIKMQNIPITRMEDRFFVFGTERPEKDWLVEYQNTDCHKHDMVLCELRKLISNG